MKVWIHSIVLSRVLRRMPLDCRLLTHHSCLFVPLFCSASAVPRYWERIESLALPLFCAADISCSPLASPFLVLTASIVLPSFIFRSLPSCYVYPTRDFFCILRLLPTRSGGGWDDILRCVQAFVARR